MSLSNQPSPTLQTEVNTSNTNCHENGTKKERDRNVDRTCASADYHRCEECTSCVKSNVERKATEAHMETKVGNRTCLFEAWRPCENSHQAPHDSLNRIKVIKVFDFFDLWKQKLREIELWQLFPQEHWDVHSWW